jgi:hypothetical protein
LWAVRGIHHPRDLRTEQRTSLADVAATNKMLYWAYLFKRQLREAFWVKGQPTPSKQWSRKRQQILTIQASTVSRNPDRTASQGDHRAAFSLERVPHKAVELLASIHRRSGLSGSGAVDLDLRDARMRYRLVCPAFPVCSGRAFSAGWSGCREKRWRVFDCVAPQLKPWSAPGPVSGEVQDRAALVHGWYRTSIYLTNTSPASTYPPVNFVREATVDRQGRRTHKERQKARNGKVPSLTRVRIYCGVLSIRGCPGRIRIHRGIFGHHAP